MEGSRWVGKGMGRRMNDKKNGQVGRWMLTEECMGGW